MAGPCVSSQTVFSHFTPHRVAPISTLCSHPCMSLSQHVSTVILPSLVLSELFLACLSFVLFSRRTVDGIVVRLHQSVPAAVAGLAEWPNSSSSHIPWMTHLQMPKQMLDPTQGKRLQQTVVILETTRVRPNCHVMFRN